MQQDVFGFAAKVDYKTYITSKEWKAKREAAIVRANGRCQKCDKFGVALEVHHKNYDRLGNEFAADLEVLCKPCHEKADRQRIADRESAWEADRHGDAMDTYATKKYGEQWNQHESYSRVAEEFDEWLARKNNW